MQREYDINGRRLQIHLGDITKLDVGAIVSSENSDLIMDQLPNASVSSAIRAVEGDELAKELARMGPIEPGRAVVTRARNLPCRWVIHAASVVKTERGHDSSLDVIREAVRSSLRLAAGLGLESVAFPAFGVRATEISREQSSQAMVEELVAALSERTSLRRVVIALLDPESFLTFFEEAMKRVAGTTQPLELRISRHPDALEFSLQEDGPVARSESATFTPAIEAEVRAAVDRLRSAAERRLLDAPDELRALGARLFGLIPPGVCERLTQAPARPVVLRIDEDLAGLPFELAFDGESFLCRRTPVSRLLVTRAASPLSSRPSLAPRARLEVLLLGGSLEALPAGARELEGVGDLLWRRAHMRTRVTILADRRATRAAVLAALPGVDLLHWCGHTHEDGSWQLADGSLTAEDLAGQALRARLVVANSCGNARGAALARGFLLAGARSYVGTLWDVDDDLALEFSLRLHEELLVGRSLGAALSKSREALAERDPLHWAAYFHYGRPGERLFEPVSV